VIDLCVEPQPVFQFKQYAKGTILRPIPTYRQSYHEEQSLQSLMEDPVVSGYLDLPMAGCKKERASN